MNFRALARTASVADEHGEPGVDIEPSGTDMAGEDYHDVAPLQSTFEPSTCSYCGATEFEPQEDNGRAVRSRCAACGGTMVSSGGTFQPDLIGSPHNHPKQDADPASGGVGGSGSAPVVLQTNDLNQRTAMPSMKHPVPEGLRITDEGYDHGDDEHDDLDSTHPGWDHRIMRAHMPGRSHSGYLEYSVDPHHDGVRPGLAVHLMGTQKEFRGQGIASAMQDHLRTLHPDHVIEHGGRTTDGQGWWGQYQDPAPHLNFDDPAHPTHPEHKMQVSAGADWCRHRHAEHCWLPMNDRQATVALYPPTDRGRCPWPTAQTQQVNCPMSEPGPMAGMSRAAELNDNLTSIMGSHDRTTELRFHFISTWADVRAKAKRIRAEGGVSVVVASLDGIGGHVQGDTGIYETILSYRPGSTKVATWTCGCAWAAYAWNRSPAYRRFEGRMCSHALALQFEALSRGMFGRTISEDDHRPAWMRDKVRQRYDRDTGVHDLVHASLQHPLDPEGVYPTDHGLALDLPPIYAFVLDALNRGDEPADAMAAMLTGGIEHAAARTLLHGALDELNVHGALASGLEVEAALPGQKHETRCPDCGQPVSSTANKCPHCGARLNEGDTGDLHLGKIATADPDDDVWWHGTPTGDLRGGRYGLHVGTHKAASEAVTARIGHPVHGAWDGTRSYGETMLAGKKTLHSRGISVTGHNCGVPDHDHLPDPNGHFPHDSHVTPESKPDIFPLQITGRMSNTPHEPYRDSEANSMMQRNRGNLGHYYRNVGEDPGSISAVVPHHDHIERIGHNEPHVDYHNSAQYHQPLKDSDYDYDEDEFDEGDHHHGAKKDEPLTEPSHAGVVLKAQDTGRVLMIQRSHKDESDPARGKWEFPGGGREERDQHSLHSGIREFEEETGHPFPMGGHVQHVWQSANGVYQGHVVVVPSEDALDFSKGRSTVNPDDPDGDDHEQSAWWHPDEARKNPALRDECKAAPWSHIKAAALGTTATYSSNDLMADPELGDYRPKPPQAPVNSDGENPGSTGFATGGDPPEFDQQLSTHTQTTPFAASLAPVEERYPDVGSFTQGVIRNYEAISDHPWPPRVGELHQQPEPALPTTTAEDEESPGERYRSEMSAEVDPLSAMAPSGQHTALANARTTNEIIAAFQATAAGQSLANQKGPDSMDIAAAARDYLATPPAGSGLGKTALKEFSFAEQQALINEGSVEGTRARNLTGLNIEGTHYEVLARQLAAQGDPEDAEDLFT